MTRVEISGKTEGKHNWVCRQKWNLFLNENYCTETGDVELHSNVPLDENTLKQLHKALRGE